MYWSSRSPRSPRTTTSTAMGTGTATGPGGHTHSQARPGHLAGHRTSAPSGYTREVAGRGRSIGGVRLGPGGPVTPVGAAPGPASAIAPERPRPRRVRRWLPPRGADLVVDDRRSDSVSPPQTPNGSRTRSACSRHCCRTGQVAHRALAGVLARLLGAAPLALGMEEHLGVQARGRPRRICQSQKSAFGPGSRETSAIAGPLTSSSPTLERVRIPCRCFCRTDPMMLQPPVSETTQEPLRMFPRVDPAAGGAVEDPCKAFAPS